VENTSLLFRICVGMEGCIKVKAFISFQGVDPLGSSRRFRFLFLLSITGAENRSRNLNRKQWNISALKFQFISGTCPP
jgi:hypothetical protein